MRHPADAFPYRVSPSSDGHTPGHRSYGGCCGGDGSKGSRGHYHSTSHRGTDAGTHCRTGSNTHRRTRGGSHAGAKSCPHHGAGANGGSNQHTNFGAHPKTGCHCDSGTYDYPVTHSHTNGRTDGHAGASSFAYLDANASSNHYARTVAGTTGIPNRGHQRRRRTQLRNLL